MPASYLPYEPDQGFLLPPSASEWLPEGHLAYFLSDSVDSLDMSAFHERYEQGGPRNQQFHPGMMVKVLVYAYATGVFSSRKIASKLHQKRSWTFLRKSRGGKTDCRSSKKRTERPGRCSQLPATEPRPCLSN